MNPVEITVTCSSVEEAQTIAAKVVERRLAACGQSWPISSCYWWNAEVVQDTEHLVLFKTVDTHFDAICDTVRELHSYDLPAIVMIPLANVGPGYLDWLIASTTPAE